MKRTAIIASAIYLTLCATSLTKYALSQQAPPVAAPSQSATMKNADVIELAGLGLSDDVIIDKIYSAKQTDFDTSIASLRSLKAAKVSDSVIRAMINPQGPNMPLANVGVSGPQAPSADPNQPVPQQNLPPAPPTGPPVYFKSTDGKVRVFVTDHPIDEYISASRGGAVANRNGVVVSSAGVTHAQTGDDPRTVEIQADIQKLCPAYVMVSNNPDRTDYILVFRRQGGKRTSAFAFGGLAGLAISAGAKVDGSSLFQLNGDMVYATKENSVEKAIRATCDHIGPPS